MDGFEVRVNGELVCRAGLDATEGVLSVIVSRSWHDATDDAVPRTGGSTELRVCGIDFQVRRPLEWTVRDLALGDRVEVTMRSPGDCDPPRLLPTRLDTPQRGQSGVLASLREEDDGSITLVFDDARRASGEERVWRQESFFTQGTFSRDAIRELTVSPEDLRSLALTLLARLAARLG